MAKPYIFVQGIGFLILLEKFQNSVVMYEGRLVSDSLRVEVESLEPPIESRVIDHHVPVQGRGKRASESQERAFLQRASTEH